MKLNVPFFIACLISAVLAGAGTRCAAQHVTYPYSHSVITYPVEQPVVVNHPIRFVGGRAQPAAVSSSRSRPSTGNAFVAPSPSRPAVHANPATSVAAKGAGTGSYRNAGARTTSKSTFVSHPLPSRTASSTPQLATNPHLSLQSGSLYSLPRIVAARQNAARFRIIAQSAFPAAAKIAAENAGFAEQWAELAGTYNELSDRVSQAEVKLRNTQRDFEEINAKLDHYGLTPTIGRLLQHKKEQMHDWQVHDSMSLFASQELGNSRQEQLKLEMVRFDGADPVMQADEILADAGINRAAARHAAMASQLESLLQERSQWLEALQRGYQDYQQKLGELDAATTASAKLTSDYQRLIDRHVTWIRSGEPLSIRDLRNLKGGFAALFNSRRSTAFGYSLQRKWSSNHMGTIGLLAMVALLLVIRWRAKAWVVGVGNRNKMRDAPASSRKLVASLLTPVVSLALPAIAFVIARWLGSGVVSESTLHASSGLYAAGLVALMVEVPRQLLRRFGFVDKHVPVELPRQQRASMYLTVIGFGLVLAAYVVTLSGLIDHGMWRDSLSRFGFMSSLLLVAWTAHLALRPSGGFLEPLIARFGGSVIHRMRLVIYLVGVGFPLTMVALSAFGYGFTANELIKRAILTVSSLLIIATWWAGVKIVSERIWQLLTGSAPPPKQYDEYGVIEPDREAAASVTGTLGERSLELKHQLAFLCQCSLVLLGIVAYGWLWIDILPNVQMGNPVVWTVHDTITQSSVDASGQTITRAVVEATPVTALHLLLAAATLFVSFQLAKLLPALFDVLVLQRVSFDEGMEHFSLVLGRCLLFGVGCFVACRWIGIRWQAIQWLAVGLTVGLGFGLQDMVRNLFGGLVVLFEKPARLGDFITVGKVTGRVAAQRLRTTVLSDDDGREVIIPNKQFVSEGVVNWMGAGRLNVIPIEVAVTRDKRPADICRELQELVIEQSDVLLTPSPQATLVCVGKRSQGIEVRAWIEEGQDPSHFRDALLQIVRRFLKDKELLTSNQPSQPAMRDAEDEPGLRRQAARSRKRSA